MEGVNGAGGSVLGTKEGVSNSNRVGEKSSPKKGQAFASFVDEGEGFAQGTKNDIVSAVAVSDEIISDQKGSNQDLVGSESCKRGDPKKNGSSWALVFDACSDEDEFTGRSFRSDTAGADKVFPAGAGAADNNGGQSKFISAAGKVWGADVAGNDTAGADPAGAGAADNNEGQPKIFSAAGNVRRADVAGSGIRKKVPARAWVKCRRQTSPTGPDLSSGIEALAATAFQTGQSAGRIIVSSDQRSSTPQRLDSGPSEGKIQPQFSCFGLGDEDFPPIRMGTTKDDSVNVVKVGGTVQSKFNSEVKHPHTARSQPVQMGSRIDKRACGLGREASAAAMQSEDAKISHNWRSLFVNRPKSCSPLAFYSPTTVDGKVTINPPAEAVVEGVGLWEGSLVGQFFDKRLPLHVVSSLVERLWGKHEIPVISTTDNGLFIFRFKDLDARDWVLENGPWYLAGRPIILRLWKPGMEMLNVHNTSLPIWVKFFNIPLEYWTATSLGYIASVVGIPLHLDTLTENHYRLSFARICIEVDVNCTFPNSALLDLGNGKYSTIRIEYPWVPQKCAHCKIFGHNHMKCQNEKEVADAGKTTNLDRIDLAKDCVETSSSSPVSIAVHTIDDIVQPTTPGKTGDVQNTNIQERLTSNSFEYLAICDDASLLEETVDRTTEVASITTVPNVKSSLRGLGSLEASRLDTPNTADFSDTSPICDTFKHIKRIDELDYFAVIIEACKRLC